VKVRDLTTEDGVAGDISAETLGALVEVAVIYSQLALVRGDITEARKLSQLALPPPDSRTVAYFNLGLAHEIVGELAAAEKALTEALNLGKERINLHIVSVAYGHLARIHRLNGQIPVAIQVCEQGLGELEEMVGRSPMSGLLLSELGLIDYEQNSLETAREKFSEAISLARPWSFWEALVPGYVGLARTRYAFGDVEGARQALDELEALGRNNPELVMPVVKSSRALLKIFEGDLDAALNWAHDAGLDVDDELTYTSEGDYVLFVRILLAEKKWDKADRLIDRLITMVEVGKRRGRLIELFILQAMSLEAQKVEKAALEAIARALELGEPNGYVRLFLDEGERMEDLLRRALSQGIAPVYVSRLLKDFETQGNGRATEELTTFADPDTSPLIEQLSDRELEVLRMLQSDLSGPEIARELSIALSTMRTHTQSIYSKLSVSNRRAAVRRAEEVNLL
jgi:LuxR family maltose regulon positive regulatory protein